MKEIFCGECDFALVGDYDDWYCKHEPARIISPLSDGVRYEWCNTKNKDNDCKNK